MAAYATIPYTTESGVYGTTLSSTYEWYVQQYQYPTITDTVTSSAWMRINSIINPKLPTSQSLPDGQSQLEYIESSGKQYVDTGVAVTSSNYNKMKIVYDMQVLSGTTGSKLSVTSSNITSAFTVSNGSYYFKGSGSIFTTTNGGVNSSTATTTLTALYNMSVTFNYSYSSEANYDKFTLTVGGTTVLNAVSGATTSGSYTATLAKGGTIVFTYAKDSSNHTNDDKCTFSNMVVTPTDKVWAVSGTGASGSNSFHTGSYNDLIYYGNGKSDVSTGVAYDYQRHTWINDAKNGNLTVSGLCDVSYTAVAPITSANLYLFAQINGSTVTSHIARFYSAEIYIDDVLTRKFVPCTNTSGALGLYDLVTKQFFANSGTGVFTTSSVAFNDLKNYVDVSVTIYSKNAITRTGTSGYTCESFSFQSQPTIALKNVTLGTSIIVQNAALTTTVADNGAGTAVSGSIVHSSTVTVSVPKEWMKKENCEWTFTISDLITIINTSVTHTNTKTFTSFLIKPLSNVVVKLGGILYDAESVIVKRNGVLCSADSFTSKSNGALVYQ